VITDLVKLRHEFESYRGIIVHVPIGTPCIRENTNLSRYQDIDYTFNPLQCISLCLCKLPAAHEQPSTLHDECVGNM
jgi:hypothetical protein